MIIDIRDGVEVAGALSMPHSPRWHAGKLWLLQSGTAEFGHIDMATGRFVPVCALPGFARGLTFVGDHAFVGLSEVRRDGVLSGLKADARIEAAGPDAGCQIVAIDLRSGSIAHRLRITGPVRELYDVLALPGLRRPMALGFKTDEVQRLIRPEI